MFQDLSKFKLSPIFLGRHSWFIQPVASIILCKPLGVPPEERLLNLLLGF